MPSFPENGLTFKQRLVQAALQGGRSSLVQASLEECRDLLKDFPRGGNTLFLNRLLKNCGMELRYHPYPSVVMGQLLTVGCFFFPRERFTPQPGDIYAAVNDHYMVAHLGFFTKIKLRTELEEFYSLDELCADFEDKPYARKTAGDHRFYDVGYWIRVPG